MVTRKMEIPSRSVLLISGVVERECMAGEVLVELSDAYQFLITY